MGNVVAGMFRLIAVSGWVCLVACAGAPLPEMAVVSADHPLNGGVLEARMRPAELGHAGISPAHCTFWPEDRFVVEVNGDWVCTSAHLHTTLPPAAPTVVYENDRRTLAQVRLRGEGRPRKAAECVTPSQARVTVWEQLYQDCVEADGLFDVAARRVSLTSANALVVWELR